LLALDIGDMDLAKEQANKPNDKKQRRKLWREIAKYLFKTEEGDMCHGTTIEVSCPATNWENNVSLIMKDGKHILLMKH